MIAIQCMQCGKIKTTIACHVVDSYITTLTSRPCAECREHSKNDPAQDILNDIFSINKEEYQ